MKKVPHRSYIRVTQALLKPDEKIPVSVERFKSAYNIIDVDYTSWRGSGYIIVFNSEADAVLFLSVKPLDL
jgi:hypothetical protein